MPPIGTTVTVMGDVIEYDGRIWLQSLGAGALEWTTDGLPEVEILAIADVAQHPEEFEGKVIQLTGFIGESIAPDATFTSAYLGDHPNYGNSEHQMHLIIRSAIGEWVEATSKSRFKACSPTSNGTSDGAFKFRDLKYWSTRITCSTSRSSTGVHKQHGVINLDKP